MKIEDFKKLQAYENIRRIYSDFKINKLKRIKDNYNDLILYGIILNENGKYIPKKEYIKLKKIINRKLNELFKLERVVKNGRVQN